MDLRRRCRGCRRFCDSSTSERHCAHGTTCSACGGVMKPDITFFGEPCAVGRTLERDRQKADLLLVMEPR